MTPISRELSQSDCSDLDSRRRKMKGNQGNPLHLKSLNHISMVCRSLEESINFYQNVLGFVPICRSRSFNFDGSWLFGFGVGIHLLQMHDEESLSSPVSPSHRLRAVSPSLRRLSLSRSLSHHLMLARKCESMATVEKKLGEMGLDYKRARIEETGIQVDQIFFHDPDGFMIEVCNCDKLPIVPLQSCSRLNNVDVVHQKQLQEIL